MRIGGRNSCHGIGGWNDDYFLAALCLRRGVHHARNSLRERAGVEMMGWIEAIWHFLFGWPSVAILVGVAATLIAVLEPPALDALIPNLRKFAIIVAVVAFSLTAIMGKFYNDGLREIKSQV